MLDAGLQREASPPAPSISCPCSARTTTTVLRSSGYHSLYRHHLQLSQSSIRLLFRQRTLEFRRATYSAQGHAVTKRMSCGSNRGWPPKPMSFKHHCRPGPAGCSLAGTVERCAGNDQDFSSGLSPGFCPSTIQKRYFWKESEDTKDGGSLGKHLDQGSQL